MVKPACIKYYGRMCIGYLRMMFKIPCKDLSTGYFAIYGEERMDVLEPFLCGCQQSAVESGRWAFSEFMQVT